MTGKRDGTEGGESGEGSGDSTVAPSNGNGNDEPAGDGADDGAGGESGADDGAGGESGADDGAGGQYRAHTRVGRWLFGDRVGLALFLGALCFGMLTWRAGIFITDNMTLARTLDALAEGRLWIEQADGDHLVAPGTEVRDGRVYGRNYGQLVASLPALWLLQVVDAVADLRVALVAGCHLAGLAFAVVASDLLEYRRVGTLAAAPLVFVSFVLNLLLATRLEEPQMALLALQVTALVVTALGATVLYRLLALQGRRRVAVLAGAASVLVLPAGFWAAIPKRHVFSVLAVLTMLYLFAASRRPGGQVVPVVGEVPLARAGAYAVVGLLTWVHAGEGLFVFAALLAVDVPTAPRNDARTLLAVGLVFAVSMLPTLVTNLLVTGDFLRPPRTLGGGLATPAAAEPGGTASGSGGGSGGALEALADLAPVGVVAWFVRNVLGLVGQSLAAADDPDRLVHVFVRSAGADLTGGRPEFIGDPTFAGTNLAVLESAPVLALCVAAVAGWLATVRNRLERLRRVDPTVMLALAVVVAFVALYLSRLPLYVQITQRYLLPVFPLGLYALARSPVVTRLVERARGPAYWSYAVGVFVGGQLLLAAVLVQDLPPGEAAQLNATVALVVAGLVVATSLLSVTARRFDRATAVAVGLACAAGTVFMLASHLHYFEATGEAILPVVQAVTDALSR